MEINGFMTNQFKENDCLAAFNFPAESFMPISKVYKLESDRVGEGCIQRTPDSI